ncbi:MAG: ABC transporter substrate-binding protein, partial [Actinobacteria bacterium]|nr:ABC transporter substrate-binding protein [Actinomycetota bacterium]
GQCDVWSDGCYSNPAYDKLYEQQAAATDEAERATIVDQMQEMLYQDVPEVILWYERDLQAWRKDRWTGFTPQPAPAGSMIYSFGPASYVNLKPVTAAEGSSAAADGDSDSGNSMMVWIIVGLIVLVGIVVGVAVRKRSSEEDRE